MTLNDSGDLIDDFLTETNLNYMGFKTLYLLLFILEYIRSRKMLWSSSLYVIAYNKLFKK